MELFDPDTAPSTITLNRYEVGEWVDPWGRTSPAVVVHERLVVVQYAVSDVAKPGFDNRRMRDPESSRTFWPSEPFDRSTPPNWIEDRDNRPAAPQTDGQQRWLERFDTTTRTPRIVAVVDVQNRPLNMDGSPMELTDA